MSKPTVFLNAKLLCLLAVIFAQQSDFAQYSIKSSAFTAVNTPSSGGSYSVKSTIGTPGGSSTASGGTFSVASSPWTVAVVETTDSPKLTIAVANGSVRVMWPSPSTSWVLQQNTNSVSSVNWSNVVTAPTDDGNVKYIIVNTPAGNRFYRLVKP